MEGQECPKPKHRTPPQKKNKNRGQKLDTTFVLKLFGRPWDIPPNPGIFPGFRRTCRTFWPPPLHVEDPHPTQTCPDQKVWVWVPFSSLKMLSFGGKAQTAEQSFIIMVCGRQGFFRQSFPSSPCFSCFARWSSLHFADTIVKTKQKKIRGGANSEERTGNIAKRRLLVNPYRPELQAEFRWKKARNLKITQSG